MAGEESPFNPEPQTEQPGNYIYWSRPITEPKANVSSEIALKGAGQAIKGGVELGIAGEENSIRNDIYQKTDQLNDQYIQRLSQADSLIGGDNKIDQPPKTGPMQRLPGSLETLTAARDNGKMSETYYYQQIYNMAKQMRSQNPMFRDYIDNQFSRITKEQPANDLIKSLTGDINAYAANAREQHNKTDTIIQTAMKDGVLGSNGAAIYAAYKKGDMPEGAVLDMVAKAGARKYNNEAYLLSLKVQNEKLDYDQKTGAAALAPVINNEVQSYADAATIPVGGQYMNLHDVASKVVRGELKVTPEQNDQLYRVAKQQRDDIYSRQWTAINQIDKNGFSVMKSVYGGSPEKAKAALELAMKPMDDIVSMYEKGDLAGVKTAEATVKSIETNAKIGLYTDKTIGQYLQVAKGLSEIAGNSPAFSGWQMVSQPTGDMMSHLRGMYTKDLNEIVAQASGDDRAPNPGDAMRIGQPITLNDAIERAKRNEVTGPAGARVYRGWLESLSIGLSDKKMPIPMRVNMVAGTYGPGNDGLMGHFTPDTINDKGQRVPGSTTAFTTLVNKKITDSVSLLGNNILEVNASWDNYKNTAQKWFGDTYHQNIEELNRVSDLIKGGSDIRLTWDDSNMRWDVHMGTYTGSPGNYTNKRTYDEQYLARARASVDNFNRGLEAIQTISKKDPSVDIKAFITKLMLDQGLQPGLLTQKLIKAYMDAQRNQATQ